MTTQTMIADPGFATLLAEIADMIAAAPAGYEIKGTTADITTCDACGRTNLKRTVVLALVDADATPTGEIVHYGVDCAATAMRTTQTRIRNAAQTADSERAERIAWAREFIAVYGAAEGNRRETARIFFARNPHMFDRTTASAEVWPRLAEARAVLADAR